MFVESLSTQEVEERTNSVFDAIKEQLKYKRRDVISESGRIITPDFEYAVYCKQDGNDPEEALIIEELTNIKPIIVADEDFNEVFAGRFSEVVFEFPAKLDVSKFIDQIEESDRTDVEIAYGKTGSWCELTFENSNFTVRIRGRELTVNSPASKSPRELIEGFFEVQKSLGGTVLAPALSASAV